MTFGSLHFWDKLFSRARAPLLYWTILNIERRNPLNDIGGDWRRHLVFYILGIN